MERIQHGGEILLTITLNIFKYSTLCCRWYLVKPPNTPSPLQVLASSKLSEKLCLIFSWLSSWHSGSWWQCRSERRRYFAFTAKLVHFMLKWLISEKIKLNTTRLGLDSEEMFLWERKQEFWLLSFPSAISYHVCHYCVLCHKVWILLQYYY